VDIVYVSLYSLFYKTAQAEYSHFYADLHWKYSCEYCYM